VSSKPTVLCYAHIYTGLGQNSGGDSTIHELLKAMVADGWDAKVLVYNAPRPFESFDLDGVRVEQQRDRRDPIAEIPKANLVLAHLDGTERSCFIARKFKTPVVQYIHNSMAPTHAYVGMKCDLAVFNSQWISDSYPEYTGARIVVRPPVNPADYAATLDKCGEITQVNMWVNKGAETFYRCAEALPNLSFGTVYGGYGPQDIREMANVTHHPNVHDMREVYGRARIILMPSLYESYGRVAVEALATGIPSIVAPTPGLKEALGDAGTYASSPEDFIQAIKRLTGSRAYNAAVKRATARSEELWAQSQVELSRFLVLARQTMETGKLLRGW